MAGIKKGKKLSKGLSIDVDHFIEGFDKYMISNGYSRTEACRQIGFNYATMTRIVKGRSVSSKTIQKLKAAGIESRVQKTNIVK